MSNVIKAIHESNVFALRGDTVTTLEFMAGITRSVGQDTSTAQKRTVSIHYELPRVYHMLDCKETEFDYSLNTLYTITTF
jgi:hypothetical protein